MDHQGSRVFARDALVALAVVAGLYGLARGVQFQPLQVPGYLLIVGFDVLERAFGSAGEYYHLLFAAYLTGLGVVGAAAAHLFRGRSGGDLPGWRLAAASALAVVGVMAVVFGAVILVGTGQVNPFLITGATGTALLLVAAALGGALGRR